MYEIPSPEELRNFLKKHDLSGSEAGRLTGVNSREVRRWTSIEGRNKKPIPWSAWSILRLLTGASTMEDIKHEIDGTFPEGRNELEQTISDDESPSPDRLRALLKEKNLTGIQAAEIVGVHQRTIWKWLGGERGIPVSAWRLLKMYKS